MYLGQIDLGMAIDPEVDYANAFAGERDEEWMERVEGVSI